jgi:hypothetical protein
VELCWATLFSHQFSDFCIILFCVSVYSTAAFTNYPFSYWVWVGLMLGFAVSGYYESSLGYLPLRQVAIKYPSYEPVITKIID